ncbi:MAG TPA: helix-turn-helix domain-containing protein [Puia sp.]|nr:helix-turn-helix domain-containing protein [Puia sp.]
MITGNILIAEDEDKFQNLLTRIVSVEERIVRLETRVSELTDMMERAVILSERLLMTKEDLPVEWAIQHDPQRPRSAFELANVEKLHIQRVLSYTRGNKVKAAKLLNIGLTTVYRKMQDYGLNE